MSKGSAFIAAAAVGATIYILLAPMVRNSTGLQV
jgi:hypothetical protein